MTFDELARHVFFLETGEPLPKRANGKTPLLGVHHGIGVYLLYNGILKDRLTNDEMAQVIDYFAGSDCGIALLVNFGRPRLEWKRLFPPKQVSLHRRRKWGKPAN